MKNLANYLDDYFDEINEEYSLNKKFEKKRKGIKNTFEPMFENGKPKHKKDKYRKNYE